MFDFFVVGAMIFGVIAIAKLVGLFDSPDYYMTQTWYPDSYFEDDDEDDLEDLLDELEDDGAEENKVG